MTGFPVTDNPSSATINNHGNDGDILFLTRSAGMDVQPRFPLNCQSLESGVLGRLSRLQIGLPFIHRLTQLPPLPRRGRIAAALEA